MASVLKISQNARDVLARSSITKTEVRLPAGKLDRALYLEVNKALVAAGGKWDRKAQAHLFDRDPREALGLTIETGTAVRQKQARQAFYTPPDLADRIADKAQLGSRMRVLEPSCGEGALVRAALRRQPMATIRAYDTDADAAEVLAAAAFPTVTVYVLDFLADRPPQGRLRFDRVLMNPPFTGGQDIQHVTHALSYLRPGGRLVSVMSPGWRASTQNRAVAFRDMLDLYPTEIEPIPAGAFKESGTNIPTVLVTIDVPKS